MGSEENNMHVAHLAMTNSALSYERTMLEYERTLIAWIRTTMSMISFGFTIYKFFQEVSAAGDAPRRLLSPRAFGMTMILFGLIVLLLAYIQHKTAVNKLKKDYPQVQRSISSVLAVLVLAFGLALFLAAAFRQ
ncbi:MAG TPA: DUF202 domain-containing protein [Ferruginibacter sp.]|jgi:putative membrane protein|nr:DUF202 domain-containing protein [Ferruginibacter sp.]